MAARLEKTTELFVANIENGKRTISRLKADLDSSVRSLLALDKKYAKAKKAIAHKTNTKNLSRLSCAEAERAMAAASVREADAKVDDVLREIEQEYGELIEYYRSVGYRRNAKGAQRELDKFLKHHLKDMEKISGAAAPILETIPEDDEEVPTVKETAAETPVIPTSYGASPRAEASINLSPINIDVTATVEAVVNEAMRKLSLSLDKRIADYVASLKLDTPTAVASAAIPTVEETATESAPVALADVDPEGAKKIVATVNLLGELVKRLDEICELASRLTERAGAISDTQRAIFESQRTATREIEGVQVKQRLVNDEQTALSEAQEVTLQHARLISESHAKLSEEQARAVELINSVIAQQNSIGLSIKETIQSQKSIASANLKNIELQRGVAEKQEELAVAIKAASAMNKHATRRFSQRKKQEEKLVAESESLSDEAERVVDEVAELVEAPETTDVTEPVDAVLENATAENTSVEETLAEEAPVEEAPTEEAPTEEAPVDEAQVEEIPTTEAQVDEATAEETITDETKPEQTPTEDTVTEA